MLAKTQRTLVLAAAAFGVATIVSPVAGAAPIPGTTAKVGAGATVVGGPTLLRDGKLVWVEATEKRWRLRVIYGSSERGDAPTTAQSGGFSHYTDDDNGDIAREGIGAVQIADEHAIIEFTRRAGSAKYSQYVDSSSVEQVALNPGIRGTKVLASCSRNIDEFNGPQPGAPSSPYAEIHSDGKLTAVSLCDQTQVFDQNTTEPLATLTPQNPSVVAIAGDYIVSYAFDSGTSQTYYVVTNWRTRAELYRLGGIETKGHVSRFALQADGSVAVATHAGYLPEGCGGTLTWHTPTSPGGVLLAGGVCENDPALSNGEIAVATEPQPGAGRRITVLRPDGTQRAIAWLGSATVRPGPFAFFFGDAAFALRGCGEAWTIVGALGTATPKGLACPELDPPDPRRKWRTLSVRVKLNPAAKGDVTITYRAGSHTFRTKLTPVAGLATARLRLPKWAAGRKGGSTTFTYPGDKTFLRQSVVWY